MKMLTGKKERKKEKQTNNLDNWPKKSGKTLKTAGMLVIRAITVCSTRKSPILMLNISQVI